MFLLPLLASHALGALDVLSNTTVGVGSSISVLGRTAYVAGGDAGGTLHVIDVTDRRNPVERATAAVCGGAQAGIAGTAAVRSASGADVFVLCTDSLEVYATEGSSSSPRRAARYAAAMSFTLLAPKPDLVIAGVQDGAAVLKLAGGRLARQGLVRSPTGAALGLTADAGLLYAAASKEVSTYNVSRPEAPKPIASFGLPGLLAGNAVAPFGQHHLLVGGAGMCAGIVDVSDPAGGVLRASLAGDNGLSIAVQGTSAYVACTGSGSVLYKIDISKPDATTVNVVATLNLPFIVDGLTASEEAVYVTSGGRLLVLEP